MYSKGIDRWEIEREFIAIRDGLHAHLQRFTDRVVYGRLAAAAAFVRPLIRLALVGHKFHAAEAGRL